MEEQVETVEPEVTNEVLLLSLEYSPLRRNWYKWRNARKPGQPFKLVNEDEKDVTITISNENYTDLYKVSDLQQRVELRRNAAIFVALQKLWTILNPFKLKTFEKRLFTKLNDFLYVDVLKGLPNPNFAFKFAFQDTDITYGESPGIVFHQFYDSMFELIDNNTRSRLVTEYVRLIDQICVKVAKAPWYRRANLASRLHEDMVPAQNAMQPWMTQIIKERQEQESQEKSPSKVVEMLTEKYLKKPKSASGTRNGSRRIRTAMTATSRIRTRVYTSASQKRKTTYDMTLFDFTPAPTRELNRTTFTLTRPKMKWKGETNFYPRHLDRVSPISHVSRNRIKKGPELIEEIIHARRSSNIK